MISYCYYHKSSKRTGFISNKQKIRLITCLGCFLDSDFCNSTPKPLSEKALLNCCFKTISNHNPFPEKCFLFFWYIKCFSKEHFKIFF